MRSPSNCSLQCEHNFERSCGAQGSGGFDARLTRSQRGRTSSVAARRPASASRRCRPAALRRAGRSALLTRLVWRLAMLMRDDDRHRTVRSSSACFVDARGTDCAESLLLPRLPASFAVQHGTVSPGGSQHFIRGLLSRPHYSTSARARRSSCSPVGAVRRDGPRCGAADALDVDQDGRVLVEADV